MGNEQPIVLLSEELFTKYLRYMCSGKQFEVIFWEGAVYTGTHGNNFVKDKDVLLTTNSSL